MKSTIKYYRGICSGLHSHLYSMGGIFTERGIDFMTAEEYRALLDVDFNNVKIEDLTDIRKIKIDKNQPQSKRQAQFLKQVGNPYMLRRGSMMIKVSFANNGLSMEQAFENLLLNVWKFVVEFQSDMCYDVFGIKILN